MWCEATHGWVCVRNTIELIKWLKLWYVYITCIAIQYTPFVSHTHQVDKPFKKLKKKESKNETSPTVVDYYFLFKWQKWQLLLRTRDSVNTHTHTRHGLRWMNENLLNKRIGRRKCVLGGEWVNARALSQSVGHTWEFTMQNRFAGLLTHCCCCCFGLHFVFSRFDVFNSVSHNTN